MCGGVGLRWAAGLALVALLAAGWPLAAGAEARGAGDTEIQSRPQAGGDDDPSKGELLAVVEGFRNLKGQLLLAVFDSEEGFPNEVEHAIFHRAYAIRGTTVKVLVPSLEPGTYAVGIHHDEDKDFEMDTRIFGIPREGFGASRDAKARFGPPKFKDARFELKAGQKLRLPIHVRYF